MRKLLLILIATMSPLAAQEAPAGFEAARITPLTAGRWSYAATASGSEARFGESFLIRCDRNARRVTLRRIEMIVTAPAMPMIITTDLATNMLPADGMVANTNRALDAIAFSRGRFIVNGGGGGSSLVLSASPEAARSIEDCRN